MKNADGEKLTEAQKGEILMDVEEKRRETQKQAKAIAAAKKSAKFNLPGAKKDEAGPSSDRSAAGGGIKAVKALSPDKGKGKVAVAEGDSSAGGGVKAALALKAGGKSKGVAGGKKAGSKGGKKGGLLAAAAEAAASAPAAEEAAAPAAPPPETAEERVVRLKQEEEAREAERERLYKEREEQRREVEQAIWAEEQRLRDKEQKKRKEAAALLKKQAAFRENAFDGEFDVVKKQVDEWIEETMGHTIIGAKIDCEDQNKTTALSEAACAGQKDICALLLKHGAAINKTNIQGRSALWRAAFMDHRETAQLLLEHGADPRLTSDAADTAQMVAASAELKTMISEWPMEKVEELMAAAAKRLEGQWVPPPPDPEDMPAGQAGYFLQVAMVQFQDALDEVTKNVDDRPVLVADLGGKIATYFSYRDCNMRCYARPGDVEPEAIRIGLLGALRFGKPLVLDMMSLELDEEGISALFDAVQPGLFKKLLNKSIMKEEHYNSLLTEKDGEEYGSAYWNASTTAHYNFVLLSKHPLPPEWCQDAFFVIRTT